MRNKAPCLDFIEVLPAQLGSNLDLVYPLFKKGLSITEISNQTGLKRTSVWKALRTHRRKKLATSSFSSKEWRKKHGLYHQKPAYGYCRFQGNIVKDPKEYPVMTWIQAQWKRGGAISSIIQRLSERGSLSRTGRAWSYNVIKSIIKRIGESSPETKNLNTDSTDKNLEEV